MPLCRRQTKVQWVRVVFSGPKPGLCAQASPLPSVSRRPRMQFWGTQWCSCQGSVQLRWPKQERQGLHTVSVNAACSIRERISSLVTESDSGHSRCACGWLLVWNPVNRCVDCGGNYILVLIKWSVIIVVEICNCCRYLESNRAVTRRKREEAKKLREGLRDLQCRLDRLIAWVTCLLFVISVFISKLPTWHNG